MRWSNLEDYYKKMYQELNQTICEVIQDLQTVQQKTEELLQKEGIEDQTDQQQE